MKSNTFCLGNCSSRVRFEKSLSSSIESSCNLCVLTFVQLVLCVYNALTLYSLLGHKERLSACRDDPHRTQSQGSSLQSHLVTVQDWHRLLLSIHRRAGVMVGHQKNGWTNRKTLPRSNKETRLHQSTGRHVTRIWTHNGKWLLPSIFTMFSSKSSFLWKT